MKIQQLLRTEKGWDSEEEFFDYAITVEKQWQGSLPRFTDKELLKIFPEAKEVFTKKIAELGEIRDELADRIKKKLVLIKRRVPDEFSQWFWREWVKVTDGENILKVDDHIMRLKRLLTVGKGRKPRGWLSENEIQQALAIPIENLFSKPLRKCGKTLVGLCPLHNERHPSFYIYPETNSCWCYGCNRGGDVISLTRLLYGYSFKETVRYLIGEK